METVEILAGAEFANAVKALGLTSAICTYHYQPTPESYREDYQVWLLSKEEFDRLCEVRDEDWKEDWGWWRHNGGYNGGSPDSDFIVNDEKILAWNERNREDFFSEDCQSCDDYKTSRCKGALEDEGNCYGRRWYKDLLEYINEEMHLSTETNVCALCISLAHYNNMTLSELFKKYLGGDFQNGND